MRTLVIAALPFLLLACASSESAETADPAPNAAPAAEAPVDDGACKSARAAALSAWSQHFSRVQELSPEDRAAMAEEHVMLPASELDALEQSAAEGGDEPQLEAIKTSRLAIDACG
jgi:hypothetical protein